VSLPAPARAATTRDGILAATYRLLYRAGFARVSMDEIAAAAGVSKRTLYHHFDSKDALVAAVLDEQRAHALAQFRGWGAEAETPAGYVDAVFAAMEAWARRPSWLGSGFTRLSLELAHMPGHPARVAARQHKREVAAWLRDELSRRGAPHADALAGQVQILMEGAMCLALIRGDPACIAEAGRIAAMLASDETGPAAR
jgi:AcrR family transcriptional regulator